MSSTLAFSTDRLAALRDTGRQKLSSATLPTLPQIQRVMRDLEPQKLRRTREQFSQFVERFEDAMHYVVALMLGAIAIATLAVTTRTLLVNPAHTNFATTTSNAVSGVLIALILVEIMRTVTTYPDSKGVAIRRLFMIAIMSTLRDVLWVGVNSEAGGLSTDRSLAMAIGSVVVVGLAFAFTLVNYTSREKRGEQEASERLDAPRR